MLSLRPLSRSQLKIVSAAVFADYRVCESPPAATPRLKTCSQVGGIDALARSVLRSCRQAGKKVLVWQQVRQREAAIISEGMSESGEKVACQL